MTRFFIILKHELKWLFSPTNIIAVILLLAVSLTGLYKGIHDHNAVMNDAKKFQEIEAELFKKHAHYLDYSKNGFQVFLISCPVEAFFSNPVLVTDLYAQVNTNILHHIYKNFKGNQILKNQSADAIKFSNIIWIPGTILALLLGFLAVRRRKYLRSLTGLTSASAVFLQLLLSRFLILLLDYLFVFAAMFCALGLSHVHLSAADVSGLFNFFLVSVLMLTVFLVSGFLTGCIQSRRAAYLLLGLVWITFIYLIPIIKDSIIEAKSTYTESSFDLYKNKQKIQTDFETSSLQEIMKPGVNKAEKSKELAEWYWNNDFKKITALEDVFKIKIAEIMAQDERISCWFPTTFYRVSCDEISSRGYRSYLAFYNYLQELQKTFLRFWIDKFYIEKNKKVINFIKGDENLYFSKSRVPGNFGFGVAVTGLWIILLMFAARLSFTKAMHPRHKPAGAFAFIDIDLVPGKHIAYRQTLPRFVEQFLNVLDGKIQYFTGKFSIAGKNAVTREKKDYLYLHEPDEVPEDMKVKDYLGLYKALLKVPAESYRQILTGLDMSFLKKPFSKLERYEKVLVMLRAAQMKKSGIIVLDKITQDLLMSKAEEPFARVKESGVVVVDFITSTEFWIQLPDKLYTVKFGDGLYQEIPIKHS